VKLVTYDAGRGPRVGVLEGDAVLDAGFDGDMVAFIEEGAPIGETTTVENARLLAPLRPRSLRDFLAFEGHLKNAFGRLGRPIPEEWYEVPAFYRGMPDTVIGPDETVPYPFYTDKLDHVSVHIHPTPQDVDLLHEARRPLEAILTPPGGRSMHDRANGLPRKSIPRTPVNSVGFLKSAQGKGDYGGDL
jgi:hypothetical protein